MTATARAALPSPKTTAQFGYIRRLLKDPQPVLDELSAEYGPVCGMGAGPLRMAIVGDPVAMAEMFSNPTDSFRWGHKFNLLGFVVGDESMIVSDGPDHRRRRSSVKTAFSRRRLNGWIPMIVERTDAAIDRLDHTLAGRSGAVDMYPLGRSLVLEIVVRALFGERMGQRADDLGRLFQRSQDYLEAPAIRQLPHPFPFTARARVRGDRKALDAIVDEEISFHRRSPTSDPLDVLAALVADGSLTDGEIRDQVLTLIGAGYDTTAASLAWMMWRTTLTPGLAPRLRAEADIVFGAGSGANPSPDHTSLAALQLANRVMRETLRLHPAGVLSPREAAVDMTVGGYPITKGTLVLWSAHLAGRDPAAWPDPLRFDPDRFLDPSAEQKTLADSAWVPFGRGARNCIGFALAQMELVLIVARLFQRLDLTPTTTNLPPPVGMIVNRPRGGVPLTVSSRREGRA